MSSQMESIKEESTMQASVYTEDYDIQFLESSENSDRSDVAEEYWSACEKYKDDFISPDTKEEPILSIANDRYTIYPIKFKDIWDNYKKQLAAHWVVEEISLAEDISQWVTLPIYIRLFILSQLSFFSSFDVIVNNNINENFLNQLHCMEAECAYGAQVNMENAHREMDTI